MNEMKTRLKFLIKDKGWSQKRLAFELIESGNDVSEAAVSKWFLGKNDPKKDKIKAICELFNCDESWLLTGNGEPFKSSEPSEPPQNEEISKIQLDKAERIKKAIAIIGLSQIELAQRLNVSQATISDFTRGKISTDRIEQLAELSCLPADWIAYGANGQKEKQEALNLATELFKGMDPERAKAAIEFIKIMTEKKNSN